MKKINILQITVFLVLLTTVVSTKAQLAFQIVKGTVRDKASKMEMPGATVMVLGTNPLIATVTDAVGNFKLEKIAVGRYDLKVNYIGYKELIVPNVLVTNGKETDLDLEIEESIASLQEVVVSGSKKNETVNDMSKVSSRSFSMEEVNRYSGGHGDPSRLVANFAGVSTPNDSRNDIVVRGNSPVGVLWRIEGLNIPNPNHFSTMGTTGGPVSALNTNILRNSDFITSAFAPEYGNATAGVFDLGFRNGNNEKREHTIQMGMFTGLEGMTEGPLNKSKGSSYVVAGRYSFTGLAQSMHMNLGTTATPKYQDLSFKLNSGLSRLGKFTLFGLGGSSTINFIHNPKDSMDIYSDATRDSYSASKIGMLGLTHVLKLNEKSFVKTILGVTGSRNTFEQDTINYLNAETPFRVTELKTQQINYSINSSFNTKVNSRFNYKTGVIGEFMNLNLSNFDREESPDWKTIWDDKNNTLLIQAFFQGKYAFNEKVLVVAGLHTQHLTLNHKTAIEPRLSLSYQVNSKNTLSFGYGWHEQMQPLTLYFYKTQNADGSYTETNRNLDFSQSQHLVVGYDMLPAAEWRVKAELYYQYLSKVPVTEYASSFSAINQGASFAPTNQGFLVNQGTGHNYGAELTVEKFFSKGYYSLVTASLYDSKYLASDGIERNTAFNGKYSVNILAGKEFKLGKDKRHVFTIDTKLTSAGGKYYTPVDLAASQAIHKQVVMGDAYAYSQRYSNYMRWDLKFGVRLNSGTRRISQSFFIDFQNVTNHKNVYGLGYNKKTNQINTAYQSGFLPNFIYRINF